MQSLSWSQTEAVQMWDSIDEWIDVNEEVLLGYAV